MSKKYIITDGEQYLKQNLNGGYQPTPNICLADTFKRYEEAKSILQYSVTKPLRKRFYVASMNDNVEITPVIRHKDAEEREGEDNKEKDTEGKSYTIPSDNSVQEWLDKLGHIDTIFSEARTRQAEIIAQLDSIEDALQDLDHYIEGHNPPAHYRCKVYNMRQNLRIKRRQLKNEHRITQAILSRNKYEQDLRKMVKEINGLKNQTYRPRILDDLFEGNVDIDEYQYLWQ